MVDSGRLIRIFTAISEDSDYAVLLGGAIEPTPQNRWVLMGIGARQILSLCGKTLRLTTPDSAREVACDSAEMLFAEYRAALKQAKTYEAPELPFHGGLMGVFGYGFYPWCDAALFAHAGALPPSSFPDALLVECRDWLLWDLTNPDVPPQVLSESSDAEAHYHAFWKQQKAGVSVVTTTSNPAYWQASLSEVEFNAQVERIQDHIRAGDLYQANLSIRFRQQLTLDPYAVFETLCERNPSPFSGLLKFPEGMLVCNSPERLVSLNPSGVAEARPIAGTRGRGSSR
ncbi:MAG: chorismate-binding protein, partial [Limisphaerales bacterium]